MEVSGGVGTIVGFVHDWANPEMQYPPQLGHGGALRDPGDQRSYIREAAGIAAVSGREPMVIEIAAGQAVMAKIRENDKAAAALPQTCPGCAWWR